MTPSQFRRGAPDAEIKFAVGECSLGVVLAAASEMGVCAILFGDDAESLRNDLKKQFPRARLIGGDEAFEALTKQVLVPLLRNKAANDPVRVWVPACATGEGGSAIAGTASSTSSIRFQDAIPRCSRFVTHPNAIIGHESIMR